MENKFVTKIHKILFINTDELYTFIYTYYKL